MLILDLRIVRKYDIVQTGCKQGGDITKKKICILIVFSLLFTGIMPAYASVEPSSHIVKPNGTQLNDVELEELKGELAPWVIGGIVGGTSDVPLKVVDNYVSGKRGTELLDGCGREFLTGAVAGALTAPIKVVTTTTGFITTAKKVYDVSKIAGSVGAGAASYAAGKIYDKITESANTPVEIEQQN